MQYSRWFKNSRKSAARREYEESRQIARDERKGPYRWVTLNKEGVRAGTYDRMVKYQGKTYYVDLILYEKKDTDPAIVETLLGHVHFYDEWDIRTLEAAGLLRTFEPPRGDVRRSGNK